VHPLVVFDNTATDLGTVIQVRHLMTPIGLVRPVRDEDQAEAVYERLLAKNYFATAVFSGNEVTGWVAREDLAKHSGGRIEPARQGLSADVLIGAGSAVDGLLERFREHNFLLVVGEWGIEGIVTPSDIGRQAGRMHLFMQVCALELALASLARLQDDLTSVVAQVLTGERRRRLQASLEKKADLGEVTDLVAEFSFNDLLRVGQLLVKGWADVERAQLDELNDFRNSVVHMALEVADDGGVAIRRVLSNLDLVHRLLAAMRVPGGTRPA